MGEIMISIILGLGFIYSLQQRWEDAQDSFLESIRLDPGSSTIHNSISPATDKGSSRTCKMIRKPRWIISNALLMKTPQML